MRYSEPCPVPFPLTRIAKLGPIEHRVAGRLQTS
ncbi:MAG: hypothetical protein QOJ31_1204 [Gaiellales bacterium]|nr:hypothetical protein [Gaiellales bacterium]